MLLALALVATQLSFPNLYRDYVERAGAPPETACSSPNTLLLGVLVVLAAADEPVPVADQPDRREQDEGGATGTA